MIDPARSLGNINQYSNDIKVMEKIKYKQINKEPFYFLNEKALDQFYTEIIVDEEYFFKTDITEPFIVDAGGHYGLSTIYFKKKYPHAKILVFEPDPNNIRILRKNLQIHNLSFKDIQIIEAALSGNQGKAVLYGEINSDNADSLGNSLMKSWGRRVNTDEVIVRTVRLSDFIKTPIDFLKLNIEGSESFVMDDLFQSKKISLVKQIYMQYHQTKLENTNDQLVELTNNLNKYGFDVKITKKNLKKYLPAYLDPWVAEMKPSLNVLRCQRL